MPTAAIIGGGVIGSAWASRFLLNGWEVRFHDPAPNSEAVLNKVLVMLVVLVLLVSLLNLINIFRYIFIFMVIILMMRLGLQKIELIL